MISPDFLTLRLQPFGLDISDLSLKVVKLEKRGRAFRLAAVGAAPINPGIISAGEIKDVDALAALIGTLISRTSGIDSKYVICSLPEEKGFLQVIQMPKLDSRELERAVYFEAENYIPLPMEEIYLGYELIKPAKGQINHDDILIVAFPRKVVDSYVICLKKAGLKPMVFEPASLAIGRALVKNVKSSPLAILDIGETRTSFMVFSNFSVRFTASIPIASQNFSSAIARAKNIDVNDAESFKVKYGLLGRRSREGREIFDALVPPLTDFAEQVKKYLDYYKTHTLHEHSKAGAKNTVKIYLCGGGAALKGLPFFLTAELKTPAELGNPWVNILKQPLKEVPELSYQPSLSYATALGLALRGVRQ